MSWEKEKKQLKKLSSFKKSVQRALWIPELNVIKSYIGQLTFEPW